MERQNISIVWFKKDLRLRDHAPLATAIERGLPTLLIFILEPGFLQEEEFDPRHGRFAWESACQLQERLAKKGHRLHLFFEEAITIFQKITDAYEVSHLFSHQETGTKRSYRRDQEIQKFCRSTGIRWKEYPQDGVIRGIKNRNTWEKEWQQMVVSPFVEINLDQLRTFSLPRSMSFGTSHEGLPGFLKESSTAFQPGGELYGIRYLSSFLEARAADYISSISSPEASRKACSRLSPYLAWGNISLREVCQQSLAYAQVKPYAKQFAHFRDRLWWRSHYMQKLETEPEIEFRAINPGMEGLGRELRHDYLKAFEEGMTGFPMVDASMRSLRARGFLNFRMRAMLATFATFTLWLPWQEVAKVLARVFLDYEPGIHYAQIQMQAGMSGYHPLRIFDPRQQAIKYDPKGEFIGKWLPELSSLPLPLRLEPWNMTPMEEALYHVKLGRDYPRPIVEYKSATEKAKEKYWSFRQRREVKDYLPILWEKHCLPHNKEEYQKNLYPA